MKSFDRNDYYSTSLPGFCITSQQTIAMAKQDGLADEQLVLSGVAILTFSKLVMNRLQECCELEDFQWISPKHHPYDTAKMVMRGQYQELDINVIVPTMGASPLACIIEDLIACGVRAVFLACAAWSLGSPVRFGDLVVPDFSAGQDGTSPHYGNTTGHIAAERTVIEALIAACCEQEVSVHIGGNATCEALYRITSQMVTDFRKSGCLCMDNGEASILFAMSRALGFISGVLFQPYINLQEGWNPSRLDERYRATCIIQADAVLNASIRLKEQGLF
jgi:uridine phosphorylase